MSRILFVHDAFPGQFVHLFRHLHGHSDIEMMAASRKGTSLDLPIEQVIYDVPEGVSQTGPLGHGSVAAGLGHDLYKKLLSLKEHGREPDAIVVHASRGASYFLRELFPNARITAFLEWYYADVAPGRVIPDRAHLFYDNCVDNTLRNMPIIRDYENADAVYAPTAFQRDQFPEKWRRDIQILHEGVDTELYKPDASATLTVGEMRFDASMEIVSYGARGMEKSRGFPQFMQALAKLQKQRPNLHTIIAAADRICYDPGPKGQGLKNWVDNNVDYDRERTHFVGLLPEKQFATLLQVTSLHCYFSIPFVLSWSCLNAMSAAAPLLASNTASVREAVIDGLNGVLTDMDDIDAAAMRMQSILEDPVQRREIGKAARQTVLERYELRACRDAMLDIILGR